MRNRATWRAARRTHFAVKYHIDQRVHVDRKARFFSSLLVNENATTQSWSANNGPEGSCAVVTVESLEKDKTRPLEWTYRKQQVVTAPAALEACSAMKSGLQEYRWIQEPRPASCEYIEFQPTFFP